MDRELAELRRGYRAEQRRAADDPRPDPDKPGDDRGADDEIGGACPFGRAWCVPTADLDDDGDGDGGFPCFSCYLRQDREDGGPVADPAGDESGPSDE